MPEEDPTFSTVGEANIRAREKRALAEWEEQPAKKKGQAEKRRAKKVKHPCKSHRIGGICALSPIDSRCTFSRTKAMKPAPVGCNQAVAKKGATS